MLHLTLAVATSSSPSTPTCNGELSSLCDSYSKPAGVCYVSTVHRWNTAKGIAPQCTWSGNATYNQLHITSKGGVLCGAGTRCTDITNRGPGSGVRGARPCGCKLEFNFPKGVILDSGALIIGTNITISAREGRITLAPNASISADGMGQCGYGGESNGGVVSHAFRPYNDGWGSGMYGAGHGGQGGKCEQSIWSGGVHGEAYGDATSPTSGVVDPDPNLPPRALNPGPFMGSGTRSTRPDTNNQFFCCGGGSIVLEAGVLKDQGFQIDGNITADGQQPQHVNSVNASGNPCSDAGGASGGTVALLACSAQACGQIGQTVFYNGTTGLIAARGGDADQLSEGQSGGGSGGRMRVPNCGVPGEFPGIKHDASGGAGWQKIPGMCQAGGAGTILYDTCEGNTPSIYVAGNAPSSSTGKGSSACTMLRYDDGEGGLPRFEIDQVQVTMAAQLCLGQGTTANLTIRKTLELSGNSEVVLGYTQQLIVDTLRLTSASISSTELSEQSSTSLSVTTLSVDTLSSISGISVADVSDRAMIEGRIISPFPLALNVGFGNANSAESALNVGVLGYIASYTLVVQAPHVTVNGKMQATALVEGPFTRNCSEPPSEPDDQSSTHPMRFYSTSLEVSGGVIASGGILVCTKGSTGAVTVSGSGFSAEGIGLAPGRGAGSGSQADAFAPGSGGGHGGQGGRSGGFAASQVVDGGKTYGDDESPSSLGSGGGGGSSNHELGGEGGGVIHIYTPSFSILKGGYLNCNGAFGRSAHMQADLHRHDALPHRHHGVHEARRLFAQLRGEKPVPGPPPPPASPHQGGGGGGAGGSILLAAQKIITDGQGSITVNGGGGGTPAGGGGGGGRVHLRPFSYDLSKPWTIVDSFGDPSADQLLQIVSAHNGSAGSCQIGMCNTTAESGGAGNKTGPDCAVGTELMLCQKCELGAFKSVRGDGACDLCDRGLYQDEPGQTGCKTCQVGQEAPDFGQHMCNECRVGYHTNKTGTAECDACPSGTIGKVKSEPIETMNRTADEGATVCLPCTKGFSSSKGSVPQNASSECMRCEPGTYPNLCQAHKDDESCQPGSGYCKDCPDLQDGAQWCDGTPKTRCDPGPKMCASECIYPFFVSLNGKRCGPYFEQLLIEMHGGIEYLVVAPLTCGLLLLVLLVTAACMRSRLMRARAKSSYTIQLSEPLAVNGVLGAHTPTSLLGSAPNLESLSSAMLWEKHKYKSKQHVHRLYLAGSNAATQPWRLPLLPPELRSIMSETQYFMLSEEFNAAAAWQQWELAAHGLLHVLPPLAQDFLARRRRRHWKRTSDVTRAFGARDALWRALHTRVWEGHRLELGCCADFSLGWIDIFANIAAPLALPRTDAAGPQGLGGGGNGCGGGGPLSASLQPASPPSDAPMQPFQLQLDPRRLDRHNGANGGSPRADDVMRPSPRAANGGKATAATPALATPAPAPAAAAEPTLLASSPSDGWLLESRSQRGFGGGACGVGDGGSGGDSYRPLTEQNILGSASDGWACAQQWRPLGDEQAGFRQSGQGLDRLDGDGDVGSGGMRRLDDLDPSGREFGGLFGSGSGDGRLRANSSGLGLGLSNPGSMRGGGATSPPPTQLVEPRVAYQLCLCGNGTFSSPLHLEMGDFVVYAGMAAALGDAGAACAACVNAKLRRVDRWSPSWRSQLRDVLTLLDVLCTHLAARERRLSSSCATGVQAATSNSSSISGLSGLPGGGGEPTALALVHLPTQEENKRFVLLVGSGAPAQWQLPPSATLLTPGSCATLSLPGFFDGLGTGGDDDDDDGGNGGGHRGGGGDGGRPFCEALLEAPLHIVFGSARPTALPRCAAVTVLLLLLSEFFLLSLLLGTLCSVPEDAAAVGVCAATMFCLPGAIVISPVVGLAVWFKACVAMHGAAHGREKALTELGAGAVGRLVHHGAVWNAASLVNALLALILFSTPSMGSFYVSRQHWMMPLTLLVTKLLLAQAFKVFAASAGLTYSGWRLLTALDTLRPAGKGAAFAG